MPWRCPSGAGYVGGGRGAGGLARSGSEDGGRGFLPRRVGHVDQRRVAVTPLEGVLEPADLPARRGPAEGVLVPPVLGVLVVAVAVGQAVPRDVVEDAVGFVTTERYVEVGVLVHDHQPLQARAREARPDLRRRRGG